MKPSHCPYSLSKPEKKDIKAVVKKRGRDRERERDIERKRYREKEIQRERDREKEIHIERDIKRIRQREEGCIKRCREIEQDKYREERDKIG